MSEKRSYCGRCGLRMGDLEHRDPQDCIDALVQKLKAAGRCSGCDRVLKICGACALKKRATRKVMEVGGPLLGGITRAVQDLLDGDEE